MKKYFFRDKDHNTNYEDNKSYHASGLVREVHCNLDKGNKSGKDLAVYNINPFTGQLEYSWRSINEVELFEVNEFEYSEMFEFYDTFNDR